MIEQKQLLLGIKTELEHRATFAWLRKQSSIPSDVEIAKHIALDHLKEHTDYYDVLLDMGL